LAAAVTNGGGLGFLAAGMLSAEELADNIVATRRLTAGRIGVNLFVPQPQLSSTEELDAFAATLAREAELYGVALGEPRHDDDDLAAKLDVVCDLRPDLVSFTFGAPTEDDCQRLACAGISSLATVTSVREALIALGSGVDALVAQGPEAGGHRGTFEAFATPPTDTLDDLVAALVSCVDCPVVAAGGIGTPRDVSRMRAAGATAVQVGTAFLLADEAGTNPVHRAALHDPRFTQTMMTRAFTGRYARALRNRFVNQHEADAIFGFPEVGTMTAPILAAAIKVGDPHGASLWAGASFRNATTGSASDIVRELAA
jgi:nitronate monooxygenase